MTLKDKITINETPEVVWPFVSDPVLMSTWNEKIVGVDREQEGSVTQDETFAMTYRMSSKENLSNVVVRVCEPMKQVVFEHTMQTNDKTSIVMEAYELEQVDHHTRVIMRLDLSQSGIPKLVLLLMKFINRFGTTQGTPMAESLKETVENMGRSEA